MKGLKMFAIGIIISFFIYFFYYQFRYKYTYENKGLAENFDTYYTSKLAASKALNARPGNEEKLIRFSEGKTKIAILYIHGFTASKGEGEFVVDSLSKKYKANTYYLRLPGHGTNQDDHATATFADYLEEVEEAIRMTQLLGEKVIVIATSMGGLLGTYLAANHPDKVDGLILCSPFYDYANRAAAVMKFPFAISLIDLIDGPQRRVSYSAEFKDRVQPGYSDYWYKEQKYKSLHSLEDLRRCVSNNRTFEKVECPVLLLYYYKDENNKDKAACIDAMKDAFETFTSPVKKHLPVSDGHHVLMSAYMRTDKAAIINECSIFIEENKYGY